MKELPCDKLFCLAWLQRPPWQQGRMPFDHRGPVSPSSAGAPFLGSGYRGMGGPQVSVAASALALLLHGVVALC